MVETSATIRLNAVDTNLVSTVNEVSTQVTNAQIATTGLNFAFKGLGKAATTSTGQLAVGTKNADTLATGFNRAASASGKLVKAIAPLSNAIFLAQQTAIALDGVRKAYLEVARIPQAINAVQASGISTQIIQDFANLGEAIRGNDVALDNLVTNAIARLGQFEAAAARAGTILRSSTRFDESGNALRANAEEREENALNTIRLVNTELKNSVTSTAALNGQYEVLSSGFTKAAESQRVLASGLKLVTVAEAGGQRADAGETLRLLTKTLNAYELSADQAASTAAKLNAVVENGLTTIQELSLVFGRTSKQAAQANITLNETGAAIAVLTSQGISTPEAGTGIARIAANIIDKTPEAEKALAKLQLRGERIRFDKAEIQTKGFTQALIDLNEAAGGSPEILAQIFPEDVAFRTVNALLAERGKKLARVRDEITKADSASLQEVTDIATSDRTKRFERLTNRLQESIIQIGLQLVPALEPGIKALESLANSFERLPDPVKEMIGNLLVLRIQTKAYGSAAKILIGTLASLAANYLLVRTISLALTGQLGKEINTIKQLITQRKGLVAATLQLFGINQKWRLAEIATTEALAKQGKLTTAIAAARNKAAQVTGNAVKSAATGIGAFTTGVSKETVKQGATETKDIAIQTAKEAIARGKEIGQALVKKTKEQVNKVTDELEVKPFFPKTTEAEVISVPTPTARFDRERGSRLESISNRGVDMVGKPDRPSRPMSASTPVGGFSFIDRQGKAVPAPPERVLITPPPAPVPGTPVGAFGLGFETPTAVKPRAKGVLDVLVEKDRDVQQKLAKQIELEKKLTEAQVERDRIAQRSAKLNKAKDKAELKLTEAKNKAIELGNDATATTEQRKKALLAVEKQEAKIQRINNELDIKGFEFIQANTKAKYAENNATEALNQTEQARAVARKKYQALAIALTEAEEANTKATLLSQQATIAKYKAEQVAVAQGATSKAATLALANAKNLETLATEALTVATAKSNIAREIEERLVYQQQLAEQGLYETKIFGNTVRLSSVGIMGAINKALTVNIGLTKIKLLTEKALNKALLFGKNLFDIRNLQLAKQNLLLAVSNVKSFATSIFNLGKGGLDKVGAGIGIVSKTLGALAPLLGVAAFGAIAFRDELFGLGAASRALAKDYQKLITEQERLADRLGKGVGLARASRALESGNIEGTKQELLTLKEKGLITTNQFASLAQKLSEVGDKKEDIKALRNEINQLGIEGKEVESGVISNIGSFIKGIPGGIGKGIGAIVDVVTNVKGSLAANVAEYGASFQQFIVSAALKKIKGEKLDLITPGEIAEAREYDALIQPLSILANVQEKLGDRTIATTEALVKYRTELALTTEVAERVKGGFTLTEADLKLEQEAYDTRIKQNNKAIADAEQIIKDAQEDFAKARTQRQKDAIEAQIFQAQTAKGNLEAQNEELQQLRSQVKKYLTEELPAIRTALQEQAQPELLLANARENFEKAFADENNVMLKPLATLREEAFKLVSAIQDSLSLGILDKPGVAGELVAAKELRDIRDEQIEFYEDGELKQGYRLTLEQRKELSKLIINLENSDLARQQQARNLEISKIKQLGQFKVKSAIEVNQEIAKLQLESTENAIAQKESEIEELNRLGVRTIEQEAELAKLRQQREADRLNAELTSIQSEDERRTELLRNLESSRLSQLGQLQLASQSEVNRKLAELEIEAVEQRITQKEREIKKRRNLGIKAVDDDIELEQLRLQRDRAIYQAQIAELEALFAQENLLRQQQSAIAQRTIFESQEQLVTLQQEKVLNDELLNSYTRQATAINNIVNLQKQITTNTVFNAEQQKQLSELQLKQIQDTIPFQVKQFEIESKITKEQNKQALLQSQQQKAEAEFNLLKLQEQKRLAEENKADAQKLAEFDLQIGAAKLQLDQADSSIRQAQFRLSIEDDLLKNKGEQLNLTQQEQILSSQIAISAAERARTEAEISRTYTSRQFAIANQLQFIQLEKQTLTDKANFRTQELNLASQLTNSEVKKQNLARNIANIKLNSLSSQLKLEAEILAYNQQQEQIQIRRDKSLNQSALQQNLADIATATAEVDRVKARGGTKAEIAAAESALEAQFAQRQALQFESEQLRLRDRFLGASQQQEVETFKRQSQLQLDQARVEALQYLPEGQRSRLARQIYNDLVKGADINLPNLGRTIDKVGKIDIEVPTLTIPEIKFPDIEDIKQDVKAIVSEFKVEKAETPFNSKQINISTLQLEAPITITITGDDASEIAEKVESRVFQGLANSIRNLELD